MASIPKYLLPKQIKNSLNFENAKLRTENKGKRKGLTQKERIQRQKKRRAEDPLKKNAKRTKWIGKITFHSQNCTLDENVNCLKVFEGSWNNKYQVKIMQDAIKYSSI